MAQKVEGSATPLQALMAMEAAPLALMAMEAAPLALMATGKRLAPLEGATSEKLMPAEEQAQLEQTETGPKPEG